MNTKQCPTFRYNISGIPALLLINSKTGSGCIDQKSLRDTVALSPVNCLGILNDWEKAAAVPYRLKVGTDVKICFLKSKPELNQKIGKISGWKNERYIVKVERANELAIKRTNFMPVGIKDLKTGKHIIEPTSEERTQYVLADGQVVNIDDIYFDIGTPVVARNLSVAKWNGESGEIQRAMEEEKYIVYMNSQESLKIKHLKLFI